MKVTFSFLILLITFFGHWAIATEVNITTGLQKRVMQLWRKQKYVWKLKRKKLKALNPIVEQIRQDYAETLPQYSEEEFDEMLAKTGRVAFYLRMYKEHALDIRYNSTVPLDKFPTPRLRYLNEKLDEFCRVGIFMCISAIYTAYRGSFFASAEFFTEGKGVSSTRTLKNIDNSLYLKPFDNAQEYFNFALTASYFMCWMTMLQIPLLKHLPYCSMRNEWKVEFTVDFNNYLIQFNTTKNKTMYAIDFLDSEPYRCAMFSFCPDPCCWRNEMVQPSCANDSRNECSAQGLMDCKLSLTHNENFKDLIENRFNVSCKCPKKGTRYDPEAKQCVDVDECAEGLFLCPKPNSVCVNTHGNYECLCQAGYIDKENYCSKDFKAIEAKLTEAFGKGQTHPPTTVCQLIVVSCAVAFARLLLK